MKGIIFTEFIELVENQWGMDMVDDLIDVCDLPSGGSYTTVGTYDHGEIVQLVSALSERVDVAVPELLKIFGEHMFGRFTVLYPQFFGNGQAATAFDFLESVESYIHVEVKKLYPTAEFPTFKTDRRGTNHMEMLYLSTRHLEDVAEGLIRGCLSHFEETCTIERGDDAASGGIRFQLTLT